MRSLGASGGGGGGEGGSSLASTPTPPPTSAAAVKIFTTPTVGEDVTVGVASNDDLIASDDRLMSISTADAGQVDVRYNAAGYYEVELPGSDWDRLVHYKGLSNPTDQNNYFQPQGVAQNLGYLAISKARDFGYKYSEIGPGQSQPERRKGFRLGRFWRPHAGRIGAGCGQCHLFGHRRRDGGRHGV